MLTTTLMDHLPFARLGERPGADRSWWLPEPSKVVALITFTRARSR